MLSLFINSARVGSTRLSQLFNQCGINSYVEPFNKANKECNFAGNKKTILKYTDLKLNDIKKAYTKFQDLNFYKQILDAYAMSSNFYLIGVQIHSFPRSLIPFFCSTYPCLITQRRNVDQYISIKKAKFFKIYSKKDTTNFKLEADAEEFYKIAMRESYFYNSCYFSAMNTHKNVSIINYDEWSDESNDNQLSKVRNLLIKKQIKFSKLTSQKTDVTKEYKLIKYPFKKNNFGKYISNYIKQDNNKFWPEKISNSSEFITRCQELGIEKLLNGSPINI